MKLLEIVNMKKHWQVWSISLFDRKTVLGVNVNELAEELYKPKNKKFR